MAHLPFTMDMNVDTNIIRERSASSSKFSFRSHQLTLKYHQWHIMKE